MSNATPWKAQADVFVVEAPTDALLEAMKSQATSLELRSGDPAVRFYPQVRLVDSPRGRAVVVTDIAEYVQSGEKRSAVVVSGVVEDVGAERRLSIRTHLEDQHTRFDGDAIVFDEHHDAIRASFISAVQRADPSAAHVARPRPPVGHGSVIDGSRERQRPDPVPPVSHDDGPDLGTILGMGLLGVGVLLLLVAVTTGSPQLIVAALALTLGLGWLSTRIQNL